MTESEAYKKIERWLLVPVDYEKILPAMAAIRNASDFLSYADKIAQAEFKATSEVVSDVDKWIGEHKNDRSRDDILAEKLNAIAGKRANTSSIEPAKPDINEQFGSFVQEYSSVGSHSGRDLEDDYPLQCRCPCCKRVMRVKEENGSLTSQGVVLMIVLFFLIGFFCLIPYYCGVGREKKKIYYCDSCNMKRDF